MNSSRQNSHWMTEPGLQIVNYFTISFIFVILAQIFLRHQLGYSSYQSALAPFVLHPDSAGIWSGLSLLSYPFAQPLFLSPWLPLYSAVALLLFWSVGREMARRMGTWRFVIFFFSLTTSIGLLYTLTNSPHPLYGITGPLFGLMAASWWYYPTRRLGRLKLRNLILYSAGLLLLLSFFLTRQHLDIYSPLAGLFLGVIFLKGEQAFHYLLKKYREKQIANEIEKELWIRERLDHLLEKISSEGGMDNLTSEERDFLVYASKHFKKILEGPGSEKDREKNSRERTGRV